MDSGWVVCDETIIENDGQTWVQGVPAKIVQTYPYPFNVNGQRVTLDVSEVRYYAHLRDRVCTTRVITHKLRRPSDDELQRFPDPFYLFVEDSFDDKR